MKILNYKNGNLIQFDNAIEKFNKLILSDFYKENIDCWIAGGSIRDYFLSRPIKTDFDLFFKSDVDFRKAKELVFSNPDSEIIFESQNGIKVKYNGKKVDLIKKHFLSPADTIDKFDFSVAMFAIHNDTLYYGETSFIDLCKKQLMINKITYPISTMSRVLRYKGKGFNICASELLKVIESIRKSNELLFIENIGTDSEAVSLAFMGID